MASPTISFVLLVEHLVILFENAGSLGLSDQVDAAGAPLSNYIVFITSWHLGCLDHRLLLLLFFTMIATSFGALLLGGMNESFNNATHLLVVGVRDFDDEFGDASLII